MADRERAAGVAGEFAIARFNGTERYAVAEASWNTYEEDGVTFATFLVRSGAATATLEDSLILNAQPFWELTAIGAPAVLRPGTVLEIPSGLDEGRDEYVVDFYYVEHEASDANRIEILAVDGDTVRARITGTAVDPNYYDGSKPRAKLEVTTTFRRDPKLERSSS